MGEGEEKVEGRGRRGLKGKEGVLKKGGRGVGLKEGERVERRWLKARGRG